MDTSKVFVCALVLFGVLSAHGYRFERSSSGASSSAGASAGAGAGAWSGGGGGMSVPWYGPGAADIQNSIQSHFQTVEAQNRRIQAQIEAQIREQQQAFSSGGLGGQGGQPGQGGWSDGAAYDGNYGGGNLANRAGGAPSGSSSGPQSAISSISVGPGGGYQSGQISPESPGIESRFGEEIPAPSGGNIGVFSSSSSMHSVGPDGKETSSKVATTGLNDNGKITFRTVHDP